MNTTYSQQLNALTQDAKNEIAHLLRTKGKIVLFNKDPNEDDWTGIIYELPDFGYYDKHGLVDYAGIIQLEYKEDEIRVKGTLKGDYSGEVEVDLNEIDEVHIIHLADYLLSKQ